MSNWDGGIRGNAFVSGGFLPPAVRGARGGALHPPPPPPPPGGWWWWRWWGIGWVLGPRRRGRRPQSRSGLSGGEQGTSSAGLGGGVVAEFTASGASGDVLARGQTLAFFLAPRAPIGRGPPPRRQSKPKPLRIDRDSRNLKPVVWRVPDLWRARPASGGIGNHLVPGCRGRETSGALRSGPSADPCPRAPPRFFDGETP